MKKIILAILLLSCLALAAGATDTTNAAKAQADKAAVLQKAKIKTADSLALANKSAAAAKTKQDSAANAAKGATQTAPVDNTLAEVSGYVLILIIIVLFVWLSKTRKLLKDPITDTVAFMKAANATLRYKNETDINKVKKPYSLSRSQLGAWTVVISCSYIFLEFCKGCPIQIIPMDATVLSLMGISAGTAAAGSVIDSGNNQVPHHQDEPSEGFFNDILSDQSGISIHRFQNVVWTLIAIIIYLWQLPKVDCGHLPILDNNLVALTGISSLTYLGLKINENK